MTKQANASGAKGADRRRTFREDLEDNYPTEDPKSQRDPDKIVTIRMRPAVHAKLLRASRLEAISMNRIATVAIIRACKDLDDNPSEFRRDLLRDVRSIQTQTAADDAAEGPGESEDL